MKKVLLLLFAFAFVATSCYKMSPEERAQKEKTVTEAYKRLAELYHKSLEIAKTVETNERCIGKEDSLIDPWAIPMIYAEGLKKFTATNAEEFAKIQDEWNTKSPLSDGNPWRWMSTESHVLEDNFHKLPADLSNLHLGDAIYNIEGKTEGGFYAAREWAVIVPDAGESNVMPKMIDDEEFESGYFKGKVLLFNSKTLELICAATVEATNSASISHTEYKGRRGSLINTFKKSADQVVTSDFQESFESSVAKVFPGHKVDMNIW